MVALTAATKRPARNPGGTKRYRVNATSQLFEGAGVAIDTDGWAVEMADTAAFVFAGVAKATADNTSGADGDIWVEVYTEGEFRFAHAGAAQTDVGTYACMVDDDTVEDVGSSTNNRAVGLVTDWEAGFYWVNITGTASTAVAFIPAV